MSTFENSIFRNAGVCGIATYACNLRKPNIKNSDVVTPVQQFTLPPPYQVWKSIVANIAYGMSCWHVTSYRSSNSGQKKLVIIDLYECDGLVNIIFKVIKQPLLIKQFYYLHLLFRKTGCILISDNYCSRCISFNKMFVTNCESNRSFSGNIR